MTFKEEEIKRAAELKLWIQERINELEVEISRLKETLVVIDGVLRTASFKSASEMPYQPTVESKPITVVAEKIEPKQEYSEIRQLRRAKDGFMIANAYISETSVAVVPTSEVELKTKAPPFKSFFINRILDGMKAKDLEAANQGKLSKDHVIRYTVDESNGILKKVTVEQYRDRTRLNEILNTAIWAFSRMLEKSA